MTALLRRTAVAVLLLGVSVIRWRVAAAHAHLFVRVAVLGGGDSPVALVSWSPSDLRILFTKGKPCPSTIA